jgi:hypothetical protein
MHDNFEWMELEQMKGMLKVVEDSLIVTSSLFLESKGIFLY